MTNGEAVNWIINISADIGKAKHRDLWHYEQALSEIREMLESVQPEIIRCKDCKYANITDDGLVKYCDIWFPEDALYQDGDYFCADGKLRGDSDDNH